MTPFQLGYGRSAVKPSKNRNSEGRFQDKEMPNILQNSTRSSQSICPNQIFQKESSQGITGGKWGSGGVITEWSGRGREPWAATGGRRRGRSRTACRRVGSRRRWAGAGTTPPPPPPTDPASRGDEPAGLDLDSPGAASPGKR